MQKINGSRAVDKNVVNLFINSHSTFRNSKSKLRAILSVPRIEYALVRHKYVIFGNRLGGLRSFFLRSHAQTDPWGHFFAKKVNANWKNSVVKVDFSRWLIVFYCQKTGVFCSSEDKCFFLG